MAAALETDLLWYVTSSRTISIPNHKIPSDCHDIIIYTSICDKFGAIEALKSE